MKIPFQQPATVTAQARVMTEHSGITGSPVQVIIIMGVEGSGKTTIGRLLAEGLGCEFHDADDFHSPQAKQKMAAGIALTDDDRGPWLEALRRTGQPASA